MDSFHGGSGDPLFMLYHEEWRGCGHYQSIEVDHHIQPNRVLQHLNWYVNKSVQQNSFPLCPYFPDCYQLSKPLEKFQRTILWAPLS